MPKGLRPKDTEHDGLRGQDIRGTLPINHIKIPVFAVSNMFEIGEPRPLDVVGERKYDRRQGRDQSLLMALLCHCSWVRYCWSVV